MLMRITRRSFLKAGIGAGAAMILRPAPLLEKKIPSSDEGIPIIGIGTARRYEEIKTDAE